MEEKKEEKVGSRIRIKNLICQKKSKMLVFQIVDDKKLILEKNLTRKSKMTILGSDDHRAAKGAPSLY